MKTSHPRTLIRTSRIMRGRHRHSQKGAALIMAMLVMLVLSAMGVVALSSVTESVWQSGNYRTRAQSNLFSNSVVNFASHRAGNNAQSYVNMMKAGLERDLDDHNDATMRTHLVRQGGYQIFSRGTSALDEDDRFKLENENIATLEHIFKDQGASMFSGGLVSKPSFEADDSMPTNFRFIMRDPLDGPPAPGYSGNQCFKKVTIVSQAEIGQVTEAWTARNNVAMSRNVIEAMIGPVDCGSQ